MDEIKLVGISTLFIVLILGTVLGIVSIIDYFVNKNDAIHFNQTIQCKQIGGVITYENYSWVCK